MKIIIKINRLKVCLSGPIQTPQTVLQILYQNLNISQFDLNLF